MIDYSKYSMTTLEKTKYTAIAALVLFAAGYLFFKNIYICIAISAFSIFYCRYKKYDLLKKRKNILNLQFKDALYSISSSLSSGKSVESAFKTAVNDLRILYNDENALVIRELELINRRVDMNETIDHALLDFAARAGLDDISSFADVFIICKNTGGNLVEVIKNTANIINQKIEIKNEIQVLISEQKLSHRILSIIPFGLLILLLLTSPDYIKPLYTIKGHLVMLLVLIFLLISYYIGSKITDIRV